MVSVVSICNLALGNLGKPDIQALTDKGAEAAACRKFYDHSRRTLLQVYPWRFAGKTQALAMVTNDKVGKWRYAYKLPNDFLKIRSIRPMYSETDACRLQTEQEEISNPYDIEGETIYCNIETAFLRYTFDLVDPTKFTALFVDALSFSISTRMAIPLTKDIKQMQAQMKLAQTARAEAETADANEFRETSDHQSELVEERDLYDYRRHEGRGSHG